MATLTHTIEILSRRLEDAWIDDPPMAARRRAAVVLLLRDSSEGPEVLLIKRAENPRDVWSGHMALPGGRWEEADESMAITAIRETREEVGINLARNALLGRLDTLRPASPKLPPIDITPFVAVAPEGARVVRREHEVAAHFWVSVESLRTAGPSAIYSLDWGGMRRDFPAYRLDQHLIWGLTERILSQFLLLTSR